ncbi:hypothetical protein BH09ACT6_BH09ACT6_25200 [soil metagenome]
MTITELGTTVAATGIETNLHDIREDRPLMLHHNSEPDVTASAKWLNHV